ncbi:18002_t:CDS:2, partial [Gigaspora margarita]
NVNNSVVFELLIASDEFSLKELMSMPNTSFKDSNLKDLQKFCANIV